MTVRFQDKDPLDVIVVEFDFSADATIVTAPTITITAGIGTDPDPSLMLVGSPTIDGATVLQRLQGGLDGVTYSMQCLAYDGSDRYSIEAVLPVRYPTALSTSVPVYITQAQFEQRFGEGELSELLSDGASYSEAENEAASLVDGYLSARYTLPLATVPPIVKAWAGDITRFKLWADSAPEEVRKRYDDSLAQLKLVSVGTISLPPDSEGLASSVQLHYGAFGAARVFTTDSLVDF